KEEDKDLAIALFLDHPDSVCFDKEGNYYIANPGIHSILKVTDGRFTTFVGTGEKGFSEDGVNPISAQLDLPASLAASPSGDLYFNDSENLRIRRVDNRTKTLITVAGNGGLGYRGDNGPGIYASLYRPMSICFDQAGNLY
ncbi:MAG: hypothetical protein AAB090_04340, partial [Nitrospirota bacterium]